MGSMQKCEVYQCTLSEHAKEVAKSELREDDKTRDEALEKFRDWIRQNSELKNVRTDSAFLLRFLRTKKFSLPLAQEMLMRYLTIRQLYPDWFQNLDIKNPKIEAIIDAGYLVPLPERDAQGRKVILSCAERFDPEKYSPADMVQTHSLVCEALLDDEESQVLGYSHINDERGLTMGHLSSWSFTDIRNMITCIQNSTPMRHKETHLINVPGCAMKIIELAMSLLNNKLRSRVILHKSIDDLRKTLDPKILPKEYGGVVPLEDMIAAFKRDLYSKRDQIKALDEMSVELSPKDKCSSEGLGGLSGSFRKLEVD